MARMTERVMVSDPVKKRLVALTSDLTDRKGHDTTYSDTIEELINYFDGKPGPMRDIAEAREW
jgi:hypothetical protein